MWTTTMQRIGMPAAGHAPVLSRLTATTPAGAGSPVGTATTTAQFLDYIKRSGPPVIQVRGTVALPAGAGVGRI